MSYEYQYAKITEAEPSGKLAKFIRIKQKCEVYPGQYFMAWVPGVGETSLPVSSYKDSILEFLATKNNDVLKKIFLLKEKDDILFTGPHGHGFPMNNIKKNEVVLVGETSLFSSLWFAHEYLLENKEDYKKCSKIVLQSKPKKAYLERLKNLGEGAFITENDMDFKKRIGKEKPSKNTVYFISMRSGMLRDVVLQLIKNGVKRSQIYFYVHRKISCSDQLCGRCMIYGKHICKDGPVFRADNLWRFLEDEH